MNGMRYAAMRQAARTGSSVSVPPDGVTAVAPEGNAPTQVIAAQSTAGLPIELEDDKPLEGLIGMREGQPAPWDVVSDAVRRGTPSGLEFGSYGALADGTPVFGFMGENGQRQVIRLTPQQWMAGLENRSLARRETQYRIDKKKTQETLRPQFQSLLASGSFDEFDRRHLGMLWNLSPEVAVAAVADVRTHNLKRDAERRMYGGEEILGEGGMADYVRISNELGLPIPSSARESDWHTLLAAMRERYTDETTVVRGRRVPVTAGAATLAGDIARAESAGRVARAMTELAGRQNHMEEQSIQNLQLSAGRYASYARQPSEIGAPDMSIMDALATGRIDYERFVDTIAAVSALDGTAPLATLPLKPDGTINWNDTDVILAASRAERILHQHVTALGWASTDMSALVEQYLHAVARKHQTYQMLRFQSANERANAAAELKRADHEAQERITGNERIRYMREKAKAEAPALPSQPEPKQSAPSEHLAGDERAIAEHLQLDGWQSLTRAELRDELARILEDESDPRHEALLSLMIRRQ